MTEVRRDSGQSMLRGRQRDTPGSIAMELSFWMLLLDFFGSEGRDAALRKVWEG